MSVALLSAEFSRVEWRMKRVSSGGFPLMPENTKTVFFPNDPIIKLIPFCWVKLQTDLYLSTGDLVES